MTDSGSNRILVLGDCIANGQNLLLPEILSMSEVEGDNLMITNDPNYHKKLMAWYLKKNKNIKHHADSILLNAMKFKRAHEKLLSWATHIPNSINLSVNGETFQGMHKKLKDYISNNRKPKIVLITDFSFSHRCAVMHVNGQQHVVKRDDTFLEHDQETVPDGVYKLFLSTIEKQKKYGDEYQKRKNQKSFYMLEKILDYHNIPWRFVIFRPENSYMLHKGHDMTKFFLAVQSERGFDLCAKKLSKQYEIAQHIITQVLPQ